MNLKQAMAELEALGSEAMRKFNRKHGYATDNQFGVKMGDLRKLAKKIKRDHALAMRLWETGNLDARLLGVLVLELKELSAKDLDRMVRSIHFSPDTDYSQLADWLLSYVAKLHPDQEALRVKWLADSHPMAARAGWSLTAQRIAEHPDGLDLSALLDRLEAEMASAPAPTKWTMNFALGGIGIHHKAHRARAIAIGEKLGVYRDFPTSKGCTSPFVPTWVAEMVRRQG